jgi:hypothetical protein
LCWTAVGDGARTAVSLNHAARKAFEMASEPRPRSLVPRVHVWSVAPSFPILRQTWNELRTFWEPTGLIKRKDEAELTIEFKNGVYWELKSADKPESLVSAGLDVLHMTETARVKQEAYTENIRPMLSSPQRGPRMSGQGLAILNSTPRGRNWFYDLWLRGQATLPDRDNPGLVLPNPRYDPEWQSWQFPTASNPHINPAEVEAARKELPANVFMQEYLAQFLDEQAGVFVNIGRCQKGQFEPPQRGRQYAIGVDLAYQQDFTVVTVMDVARRHVVASGTVSISPLWADQEPIIMLLATQHYNNAPIAA